MASSTSPRINTRLLNVNEERLNTLTPLRGYASKDYVSLDDAVKPLHTLVDDVDTRVWTATQRSLSTVETLTPDESAAIILYTIEWDTDHPSLYSILNNTLRLENRDALKPWFSYLKLLLSGLFKLPSVQYTVWRSVREDLSPNYKLGEFYTWWAFNSCTASISMLTEQRYLGQAGSCTLFAIECFNGKNIKRYSYYAQEDEILLLPCTYFKVIDKLSRPDGLHIIHLREELPPYILLEPPFPILTGSVPDQLNNKQYQKTLKLLVEEKECLKIQISNVQSENEALKNQCAKHQEAIISTESNEYLNKEIERLNKENECLKKENQCLKKENQCVKEELEITRLNIQSSHDDSTKIRETAKCLITSDSTSNAIISNKAYRYSTLFTVYTVDATVTRLANTGDLYVNIHLFNDHKQTKTTTPSFPLLIEETLSFEKVFKNCTSPADIIAQLENENVLIELCQATNSEPICLATYNNKAKKMFYPFSNDTIAYNGPRRIIYLDKATNMSGISSTFAFSVSPTVEEIL